jgi:hypothetical protein
MRALKTLVIGMGVLIVTGLTFLGWGLYRNTHRVAANRPAGEAVSELPQPAPVTPPGGYFSSELPIPSGSKLEQVTTAGDRIVLRFTGGDGDRLLVVDPHNGQVTGSIALVPERR